MALKQKKASRVPLEKRRIHISSKRQITIPAKYFEALGFTNEVDCIYAKNMLILTPVRAEGNEFADQILADLIKQGLSGDELLQEFKRVNRKIRPAVEKMIEEADLIAREASATYYDITEEIFSEDDEEGN